jgi:hypothetical protein
MNYQINKERLDFKVNDEGCLTAVVNGVTVAILYDKIRDDPELLDCFLDAYLECDPIIKYHH